MSKQPTTALARRTPSPSIQTDSMNDLKVEAKIEPPTAGELQFISNSALKVGTHILAGVGAGKSKLLAHIFAWHLLTSKKPGVIFDPTGGVVDHLCNKILKLPAEEQEVLWQRIVYINDDAKDLIFPSPLYYRLRKDDTLFEIANRFPSVLKKLDPDLTSAPILGKNALEECAIYAGQIASASNRQLDFVADLIEHPGKYKVHLRQIVAEYPELQPAVEYFRALMDPSSAGFREKKTGSFRNKLLPFLADPIRMATYAGKNNRRNWKKFIKANKVVIVDYRNVLDADNLQFDMTWDFKGFVDAIKQRGMAGRGCEVTLIIDEITAMLGQRTQDGRSILAEDLQELISRLGRNYGVNTIIAHQSLFQVDERIQEVLMGMGNQFIGQLSSPDDAVRVARQFLRHNPYLIKKTERVWHTVTPLPILSYFGGPDHPYPQVIDVRTQEFTPEEQLLTWVNKILNLDRFQFLAQIATGEGGKKGKVKKITIANFDKDLYPKEDRLAALRQQLSKRDGIPVETVLAEIRADQTREPSQQSNKHVKIPPKSATVNDSSTKPYDLPADNLSGTAEPTPPIPDARRSAKASEGGEDEPVFQ